MVGQSDKSQGLKWIPCRADRGYPGRIVRRRKLAMGYLDHSPRADRKTAEPCDWILGLALDWQRGSSSSSSKVLHNSHWISMSPLGRSLKDSSKGMGAYMTMRHYPIPWHNIFYKIMKMKSIAQEASGGNCPSNMETQRKTIGNLQQGVVQDS